MTTASDALTYPFAVTDPFRIPDELVRLRREEPIARVRVRSGDEVWLVTRAADVRTVMSDHRFSRNFDRPDVAELIPGVRQPSSPFADPPVHSRWRRLVSKAFTPRQVEAMRGQVEDLVEGLLDRIEAAGQPADLIEGLAFPLPIGVICLLLGISVDQHAQFRTWADVGLSAHGSTAEEKIAAFTGMAQASRDLIAARRVDPGPDLLSRLITVHDTDDGRLSEDELVATTITLLIGGYENTAHQIGKGLITLFHCPDQLAALRADPGLIGAAVEETLRYAGSLDSGFGSSRYATVDLEVGGTVIPAGATVLVLRSSANRDECEYADPDRFDINREPRQHFAFGVGPHFCLGASLARLELEMAYGRLLGRFPDLRLTVPVEEIPWSYRVTAAGPSILPVRW
jgi:cytochrome P450